MQGSHIEYLWMHGICWTLLVLEYQNHFVCVCVCFFVEIRISCVFFRRRYPATFAHPLFLSLYILDMCHCCLLGPFSATNRNRQCRTGENIINCQSTHCKLKISWNMQGVIQMIRKEVTVSQFIMFVMLFEVYHCYR